MDRKPISVVITTYNRKEKVLRCINAVLASSVSVEIIVIDDFSSDGTSDSILKAYPQVHLIRNENEMYVARCRNIGACCSNGKTLVFLDDDVVVDNRTIERLVAFLDLNPYFGIVGATVFYLDPPDRFLQAGVRKVGKMTGISYLYSLRDVMRARSCSVPLICESVVGDVFAVGRNVFEMVGGFDGVNFPQTWNEGDFCTRAALHGYLTAVDPNIHARHDISLPQKYGMHTKIYRVPQSIPRLSPKRLYDTARGRSIYLRLYSGRLNIIFFPLFMHVINLFYLYNIFIALSIEDKVEAIRKYSQGLRDGILMKTPYYLKA
jgi:hypothetical protein